VGIGEGVSPSAATDLIARTIPVKERSRAVGFVFGGLSLGSVMGLLLAPPIIETFNWESVFYLFGLLGVGWFVGFQFLNEEEVSYKGGFSFFLLIQTLFNLEYNCETRELRCHIIVFSTHLLTFVCDLYCENHPSRFFL
jgi:MFS family permease